MCAESRVFTDFAAESREFDQTKSREEDLVWKKRRLPTFLREKVANMHKSLSNYSHAHQVNFNRQIAARNIY
jgi:hypothetical protein